MFLKHAMLEVARKLLRRNRPIEEIVEGTGLTHEEVNNLLNALHIKRALKMAGNLSMSASKDEHERAIFRSRRKCQSDLESNLATAEDRGEQRKAITIARNLLEMNLPLDQIATATGLTIEEVNSLRDAV